MLQTVTRASEWVRSIPNADMAGTDLPGAGQRRAIQAWTAGLILLCLGTLWLEFRHIESTLPYPRHVDEAAIAGPAHRTVETGTLHPFTFNYPSLPKYLASAGMAVGFLRGAAHLEIRELRNLGNMGYPYYQTPRVMGTARQLFAVLSVVALAATGVSAWFAFRNPAAILLAPLILLTSPLFFFHSWTYLNVDIVGTCFVVLTLAACLLGTRRPSFYQSVIAPAVCVGLATGSRYTLALVALPVFLAIGLYFTGARKVWVWLAALATMAAAFVAVVPYSLIDIPAFLNGVAFETFHYASGHRGFDGEPGLPQLLFYLRHFAAEFGVGGALLAVVGLSAYAVADWRRAAVLAIFPVGLLWMLLSQRVHFTRNVLSLHPFVAIFAAFGLISLHGWVLRLAAHRGWDSQARRTRIVAGLILVVAMVPLWHFADPVRDRTDSRNLAQVWLEGHVPPGWTVVTPTHLCFDARWLEARGRKVVAIDLQLVREAGSFLALLSAIPGPAVLMVPRWGADPRFGGGEQAAIFNELSRRWKVLETFGTNDVLVNYVSTPWGYSAFAVAILK